MKMSIHRALGELKTLEKRIDKEIKNGVFIGYKKKSVNNDMISGISVDEFNDIAKSTKQSIEDLITRRKAIKEAIVNSNANTLVTIGGKEMTVASAIERKDSIYFEVDLLQQLKTQYNNAVSTVNKRNDSVEVDISNKVDAMLGSEKTKNEDMVLNFANQYRENNSWETIDPLGLKKVIDELEEEIITFENEVDVVLSESNATTFIEVE